MKRIISVLQLMIFLELICFSSLGYCEKSKVATPDKMVKNIHWFGQAAVKIDAGDQVIYIDPYRIKKKDKADIVLITHSHSDHLSPADVSKVLTENTVLIAPKDCIQQLEELSKSKVIVLEPGENFTVKGILIEAVPAYNIVKKEFHPKKNKWVGYVMSIEGVRIYHSGDTERIPEMKDFSCDIAMLPLGQTYTMNSVKEAAESAQDVKAKIAIPIHYGLYEGTAEDAEEFKEILADKIEVIIIKKGLDK